MRLQGLDIARFLAFCGMVLVNFRIAAEVTSGADLPSLLTNGLEGRASALFVVLAGVGLSMGRPQGATLLRRALFLFVIGLLNLLIFEADILHFYALYFLIALPFVAAPTGSLPWAALGAVMLGLMGLLFLDYEANWTWETLYYQDFWTLGGFLRHSFLNGWHPVFPWVAFLFIGMWIGRQELSQASTQRRLMIWGVVAAIMGLLPSFAGTTDPDLAALLDTKSMPPGPFYILAASGSAVAVIGLMLRLAPLMERVGLAQFLAVPGRMALSLYVLHILLGMGTLEALGLLDGSLSPWQIFAASLGFCALSALMCHLWSRISRQGPLEMAMRRLSG